MPMSLRWFNKYSGFWSSLQLIGVITAIGTFLYTQYAEKKKIEDDRIDSLINARNSINYLTRYIPIALGLDPFSVNKITNKIVMENCLERVKQIDVQNIYPPEFSEAVISTQIEGSRALSSISKDIPKDQKGYIITITRDNLSKMTNYIRSQVEIDEIAGGTIRRKMGK